MTRYSVTVTMTPRQAIDAERALYEAARQSENSHLDSASARVYVGLLDAGWEPVNVGTEDEPRWGWHEPAEVAR